ncbi:hypothetical protein T265_13618, partial [Opisthorchis viverrini]
RSRNSHPLTSRTWIAFRPGAASARSTPVHNASNPAITRSRHFSDNIETPNGRSPTEETAGEKASQRARSVSTSITQKGHELLERIRERRGSRQTPTTETICKICREAREIWKRSGAWFYKTLPRPSSPAISPTSPDMMLSQTVSSPTELVQPVTAAQTEQEPTSWIKLQPRRQFSKRIQRDLKDQPTSSASQRLDKPEDGHYWLFFGIWHSSHKSTDQSTNYGVAHNIPQRNYSQPTSNVSWLAHPPKFVQFWANRTTAKSDWR